MAVSRIFPTSAVAHPFSKPKNPTGILPTRRTHLLDMWMEKNEKKTFLFLQLRVMNVGFD